MCLILFIFAACITLNKFLFVGVGSNCAFVDWHALPHNDLYFVYEDVAAESESIGTLVIKAIGDKKLEEKDFIKIAVPSNKQIVVGADPDCDIVLHYQGISSRHALFYNGGSDQFLENLTDSSGTKRRQDELEPHVRYELSHNCPVTFGSVFCIFEKKFPNSRNIDCQTEAQSSAGNCLEASDAAVIQTQPLPETLTDSDRSNLFSDDDFDNDDDILADPGATGQVQIDSDDKESAVPSPNGHGDQKSAIGNSKIGFVANSDINMTSDTIVSSESLLKDDVHKNKSTTQDDIADKEISEISETVVISNDGLVSPVFTTKMPESRNPEQMAVKERSEKQILQQTCVKNTDDSTIPDTVPVEALLETQPYCLHQSRLCEVLDAPNKKEWSAEVGKDNKGDVLDVTHTQAFAETVPFVGGVPFKEGKDNVEEEECEGEEAERKDTADNAQLATLSAMKRKANLLIGSSTNKGLSRAKGVDSEDPYDFGHVSPQRSSQSSTPGLLKQLGLKTQRRFYTSSESRQKEIPRHEKLFGSSSRSARKPCGRKKQQTPGTISTTPVAKSTRSAKTKAGEKLNNNLHTWDGRAENEKKEKQASVLEACGVLEQKEKEDTGTFEDCVETKAIHNELKREHSENSASSAASDGLVYKADEKEKNGVSPGKRSRNASSIDYEDIVAGRVAVDSLIKVESACRRKSSSENAFPIPDQEETKPILLPIKVESADEKGENAKNEDIGNGTSVESDVSSSSVNVPLSDRPTGNSNRRTSRRLATKVCRSRDRYSPSEDQHRRKSTSRSINTKRVSEKSGKKNLTKQPQERSSCGKEMAECFSGDTVIERVMKKEETPKRTSLRKPSEDCESSSSHSSVSSTSKRKMSSQNCPRVLFCRSELHSERYEKIVNDLKGIVLKCKEGQPDFSSIMQRCTHVVTGKFERTTKLLCAVGLGKYIVDYSWLDRCEIENDFVDAEMYCLKDKEAERTWGIKLKKMFNQAKERKLFEGKSFYLTKNLEKPNRDRLIEIIECSGGKILQRPPCSGVDDPATTWIVASEKDKRDKAVKAGLVPVVDKNFVLMGILQQKVDTDCYLFARMILCYCISGLESSTARIYENSQKFSSKKTSSTPGLPHCTRTAVMTGEIVQQNFDTTEISVLSSVQLKLGLHETACFHIQLDTDSIPEGKRSYIYNGSLIYTLQYSSLEQHHSIRQRYKFGIPKLKSNCVCDCAGGDDHCSIGYSYRNCSKRPACYTTYHPHQKSTGCPHGQQSELCCDISVTPYKDWHFWGLNLGNPDTVAVFHYRLYTLISGEWLRASDNKIQVPMNKGEDFYLGKDKLRVQVSGSKPSTQLSHGMYLVREEETRLRRGVPVNQLHEWSLGKLGWFRFEKDIWSVRSGWIKLQDAHHVNVKDCKGQKYTDSFNAEYYVSDSEDGDKKTVKNFHLGHYIESLEPWVKSAAVPNANISRHAIVSHRHSPYVEVDITMKNRPVLRFYHHSSKFRDFHGKIQLDKHSNRFLNISFLEAQGTLIGSVYHSEQKRHIDVAFSLYIGTPQPSNHTSIMTLPYSVNSSRWVCFYPSGQPDLQLCRWTKYHAAPLSWFVVPHQWSLNQGNCEGCNENTVNNFLQYLNPKQWLNGISGSSEALAMGLEITVYLIVGLVIVAIIRKCIYPLVKWTVCSGGNRKSAHT